MTNNPNQRRSRRVPAIHTCGIRAIVIVDRNRHDDCSCAIGYLLLRHVSKVRKVPWARRLVGEDMVLDKTLRGTLSHDTVLGDADCSVLVCR